MIVQILTKLMLVGFALFMSATIAFAGISLDAAKKQGLVGEQPDGLIGIVSGASPDVKQLVESTNSQRMEKYNKIAAKNGTPVSKVQAVAGQKLINGTAPGEYFKNSAGSWQQK